METRCKNEACQMEFDVREEKIGSAGVGCKESEEIRCPYCNNLHQERMTSGRFVATKI
ncbi:hypothetical protein [uncultured Sphingobacterium sp.]|uniref:hypothetical protein n=1 Tax=uncultured Sphingobacterium sp. TaxID=182688 RepID=UPI003747E6CA